MQTPVVSNNNSTTTTLNRDTVVQQQQQNLQLNNNNNNNNNNTLLNNNTITLTSSSNNNNNNNGISINSNNSSSTINNNNNNNAGLPGLAKAVLICRQNSHPFNNRTLFLEPLQEVKVGRSVARNRVSENNAIFDCKVLSRNHAVLWYNDGKFFIKDTGSSNGTFINNVRLSQTSAVSEPYEVSSGDIVQFGVDVMENTRRETHGCIVATLKLFLPDGRETKASQSIGVGGQSTKIPPVDLYRLNQYIQEANQREQILETKLTSLQKMVEATKHNSALGWQAMIDEDRLLSRIDMLEKKLQYFQKSMTDDKLREELLKLQDEKFQYQNSAKETLWKVHQERLDATHKVANIEKALFSSEDECSLLREQLNKTQLQLQEVTGRLDALQGQYDEKVASSEEQLKVKESEVANLSHEINLLQEKISFYAFYASDEDDHQQSQPEFNNSAVSDWLLKSDIKKLEGSEDIIKAICNDAADPDVNVDDKEINLEDSVMQLQKRILTLERNISLFMETSNAAENENLEPNDNASMISTSTTSTTTAVTTSSETNVNDNVPVDEASETMVNSTGEECDGNQNVSTTSAGGACDSLVADTTASAANNPPSENQPPQQKRPLSGTKLPSHLSCELNQNVLRRNLKHIKNECALLLRQVSKTKEDNRKAEDSAVAKAKYNELEEELLALKHELDSRPKSEELEKKQKMCVSLTESLAALRIEAEELRALNVHCHIEMDRMAKELLKQKNIENDKLSAMVAFEEEEPIVVDQTIPCDEEAVGKESIKQPRSRSSNERAMIEPQSRVELVDTETQTELDSKHTTNDSDLSISSNLEELDDYEEDDDEKTETIDTTEIFVGQRFLNESGISNSSNCGGCDSVTSNSHSNSSPSDSNISLSHEASQTSMVEQEKLLSGGGEPNGCITERVENLLLDSSMEYELELINHPDVRREEELIAFKEKYTHLTQENIRLNQQLQKLSEDFSQFKSKSFLNLLMYIAPVIVIVGYLMFKNIS